MKVLGWYGWTLFDVFPTLNQEAPIFGPVDFFPDAPLPLRPVGG